MRIPEGKVSQNSIPADSSSKNFVIRKRIGAGNAVISNRNFKAQDLVLEDLPLVVAPILALFGSDEVILF